MKQHVVQWEVGVDVHVITSWWLRQITPLAGAWSSAPGGADSWIPRTDNGQ